MDPFLSYHNVLTIGVGLPVSFVNIPSPAVFRIPR